MSPVPDDPRLFWPDHTPLFWDETEEDLFWGLVGEGAGEGPPVVVAPPIVPVPAGAAGPSLSVVGVYKP